MKCSHGATVADLSVEELFYLQSRGYSKEEGRALLIKSSVLEFSKKISCKQVQGGLDAHKCALRLCLKLPTPPATCVFPGESED